MNPYEAYQLFNAIKMHFTSPSYDFFTYNGKTKTSLDSFEKRSDKFQFSRLAKKKDLKGFLVANFVDGNVAWVGDLLGETAEATYIEWLRRQQSLSYIVQSDLKLLEDDFKNKFKVVQGQAPEALIMYRQKKISIETMTLLNNLLHYFEYWDKLIIDTIVYPKFRDKCLKYQPFIDYDRDKLKKLVKPLLSVPQT